MKRKRRTAEKQEEKPTVTSDYKGPTPFWNERTIPLSKVVWSPVLQVSGSTEKRGWFSKDTSVFQSTDPQTSRKLVDSIREAERLAAEKRKEEAVKRKAKKIEKQEPIKQKSNAPERLTDKKRSPSVKKTEEEKAGKSKTYMIYKERLRPNKVKDTPEAKEERNQRHALQQEKFHTFKKWFGCARWLYNKYCDFMFDHFMKTGEREFTKKQLDTMLRREFGSKKVLEKFKVPWLNDLHSQIKDKVMAEFITGYRRKVQDHIKNEKKYEFLMEIWNQNKGKPTKSGKPWREPKKPKPFGLMKHREKTDDQSIPIPKLCYNTEDGKVKKVFSGLRIKKWHTHQTLVSLVEEIPELEYEAKLIWKKGKGFFFSVPERLKQVESNPTCGISSIDPGIRTFATIFKSNGEVDEWASGKHEKLFKIMKQKEQLLSQIKKRKKEIKELAKTTGNNQAIKERNLKNKKDRKRSQKKQFKLHNLTNELHINLVNDLVKNNQVVLYPVFPVSQMVRKEKYVIKDTQETPRKRKLSKINVRKLLGYRFHAFKQRLEFKVKEYPQCTLISCSEAYTSKTCGNCGEINEQLGSSKCFICPKCEHHTDRDVNGARNILLRYLTENDIVLP